ncbi:AAA family ATPase [Sphingomonas sp. SFZ2018-12]|uniref:AAA family ATPase n=1 Tax=Sphingomonas sp. SFZ2018-12 TaxID=2683197 RepID=UPI00082EF190|nr:ATP-binding protein [Sphingomonas sp. SFZ2018-12]MCH4893401.1 AAA family ATPase [Sphingomonas sp. SFZ2018-12]
MTLTSVQPPRAPALGAQLTNMSLALRTMARCHNAGDNSPRLSVLFGPSGYGKSVAAAFTAVRTRAVYVEAKSVWTQRSILEAIAKELGIARLERTAPGLFQQIVDHLIANPSPLIIDEMDYLVKRQAVDLIRDIHDATRVGIMMIGMESLPSKLRAWEQFHNRIVEFTQAQPASVEDGTKLRDHYCTAVQVADDLVELIVDRCHGVTRRIVNNLKAVEREALEEGIGAVDRDWWGGRAIVTGDVPTRRLVA